MRKIVTVLCIVSLSACMTTTQRIWPPYRDFKVEEIDAVQGQWEYNLSTNNGTKIKGFFQIEPSNTKELAVVGQAYFDKDNKAFSTENLRGVWTGKLKRTVLVDRYELLFSMKENPIHPNTPAEKPYEGVIVFDLKNNQLHGTFNDHAPREGIAGTITARKRA